jgi:pectin methylesterase-like acyl-CoA thioesterase
MTFDSAPEKGKGTIAIHDAADGSVVDTIDVEKPTRTVTIGGLPNYSQYTCLITDTQAEIFPTPGALKFGKTYYVTADAGVLADSAAIDGANAWRFSTKPAAPPAGVARITVAADGSGDFARIQAAIDSLTAHATQPTTLLIRNGTYHEIICLFGKDHVTLSGEDRQKTVIAYPNNDRFNNQHGGNPFGPGAPLPVDADPQHGGAVYRRGVLLAHQCKDLTVTNLTIRNTTPHGGSQSEAILINGSATDAHTIVAGVDLYSFQDTLQINGQAYLRDCHIEGDVDFLWGTGPCFFEDCQLRALRANGTFYTQIRNPPTNHGYVFKRCTFDGAEGVSGALLSRIAPSRFPASEVVLIDCTLSNAIRPIGWEVDQPRNSSATRAAAPAPTSDLHFWEYSSHTADGTPVDVSHRHPASRQLKLPDDRETIEHYSDPAYVLGGAWTPVVPAATPTP